MSFVYKRRFHQFRWTMFPCWIYFNFNNKSRDLREATPLPVLLRDELKPEYYWPELIH